MLVVAKVFKLHLWLCLWLWLWLPILASGRGADVGGPHVEAGADACLDFYEHACGRWAQVHENDEYFSEMEHLDHVLQGRLAGLLKRRPGRDQPYFVHLLHASYAACRGHKQHDPAQFVRWLREWNSIDLETGDSAVSRMLRLLKRCGLSPLLQYEMRQLQAAELGEAEQWLLHLWPAAADEDADANAARYFLPLTRASFRQLCDALQPAWRPLWPQVKLLESQLLRCVHDQAEQPDDESQPVVLLQVMPWLLPLPDGRAVSAQRLESHLPCLSTALAAQPDELVAAYLQLRLLRLLQLRRPSRLGHHECAAQTHLLLTPAAEWLQHQQLARQQREQRASALHELFETLRRQFRRRLQVNRNQFRASTQRFLLEKLQAIRLRVGVLPEGSLEQQRQLLEQHYAPLELNSSDYYGNSLALLRQTLRWAAADAARSEVASTDELYLVQSDGFGTFASAFFLPSRELVVLPLALLAGHLYRPGQSAVRSYSGLGFLLGHELSHGFTPGDVLFRGHALAGKPRPKSETRASWRFGNQTRCLKRRYRRVADEKFADLNGLDLAHSSCFGANLTLGRDPQQHQQQQQFFVHFAQYFCRDEQQEEDTSLHGSSRQRVNDAVASLPAFARAFGCAQDRSQQTCQLY